MASRNGVVTTQIKKRIEVLLPDHYHKLAFNFLDKIKLLDKNMHRLQEEMEELSKITYTVENGSQSFTKKLRLLNHMKRSLNFTMLEVRYLDNNEHLIFFEPYDVNQKTFGCNIAK